MNHSIQDLKCFQEDFKCCQSFEPEHIVENQIINCHTLYLYGVNPRQIFFKNCLFTNIFIHNVNACRFDSCIFHQVTMRKGMINDVELHDCVFYDSDLINSDVNNSTLINCSLINIFSTGIWAVNCCLKDITFNPKTQEWFNPGHMFDMINCKIWRSNQWVYVPGFCDIRKFFNL